jgi:membrane protease YdiL (CAAX protease family)
MSVRKNIRSIALAVFFSSIGFVFSFLLKKLLDVDLSRLEMAVIAFVITTLSALLLFPKVLKIPFGKVSINEFAYRIGLYTTKSRELIQFALLGILAATLSLSGMLLGSVLTGKYEFDSSTINISQAVFSLTPGIWEEVFYRGIIMIVLLRMTKSFKKAATIQVVIFALAHIKGFDFSALLDVFSVFIIAIGFTYMAYKTKSLIPGIIFHYLHDTFLFSVQNPAGQYVGAQDKALFYAALWLSILVIVVITKQITQKFRVVNEYNIYQI